MLHETAQQELGPDVKYYDPTETYFVNFLREPPEPTGDEPEDFVLEAPKIYEEIPKYSKLQYAYYLQYYLQLNLLF